MTIMSIKVLQDGSDVEWRVIGCADKRQAQAKPKNLLYQHLRYRLIQPQNTMADNKDFTALGVDKWLVESLRAMAIRKPTPIQSACIGPILEGTSPLPSSAALY